MTPSSAAGSAPQTAPRTSLRSEYRELTRKRLLEAVREVLEETDYAAATVDEIVRRAGASRATFYVHFRSKAEAAAALLERVTPSDRGLYATLPKALRTRAGLRRWLEQSLGWYESHARLLGALNEAMAVEGTVAAICGCSPAAHCSACCAATASTSSPSAAPPTTTPRACCARWTGCSSTSPSSPPT